MLCLLTFVFLALPACGGGGSRTTATQQINSTTKGQELMDLRKAYDQGIISEREYNKQKERVLERK